ncbi:hypothetical protein [Dyella monticola]|nr:hypothetical protein [Dyella monticola]
MNANHEELLELGTVSQDTHGSTTPPNNDGGVLFKPQPGTAA